MIFRVDVSFLLYTAVSNTLVGYHFCAATQAVLREGQARVDYETAGQVCRENNGKVMSLETFASQCRVGLQLNSAKVAWLRSRGYVHLTGKHVHWSTNNHGFFADHPLRIVCESRKLRFTICDPRIFRTIVN